MKTFRIEDFVGGWFVGDFDPAAYRTSACEVSYKVHSKDEVWPAHVHRLQTEINCVIAGRLIVNGQEFKPGDVFVVEPGEPAAATFPEDVQLIVVKVPSNPLDKHPV